MARRKKAKEERYQRDPSGMMMLSLNMILLAFFILLVALSQPDRTKQAELAIEVRKAFQTFGGNYLGLGTEPEQRGVSRDRNPLESSEQVEQFLGELSLFIEQNKESKALSYEIRSEGMALHVSNDFAFAPGTDQLLERSRPVLTSIQNLIARTTNRVRIEGHTDTQEPLAARYGDRFQLSAARALAVFRFLTASGSTSADRFSLVGFGSNRPLDSNLTETGRQQNRRVTITLIGRLHRLGE
jgi:chemotaxis protein MotB